MNTNIDLPMDLLYKEGNIWINGKNKHLRYSTDNDENTANSWINPISTYFAGSKEKIKKGQPVSVGIIEQLDEEWSSVGPAAIVNTNPQKNQWCIGLALEPGDSMSKKEIHVQSHGQLEYELTKRNDDDYYLPPYSLIGKSYKFDWTYNDVGKPVYVSNLPGHVGELTLSLADATYDGATIICVGRIADAPLGTESTEEQQKILIEIQLSGDVRGVVDSTQLAITIAEQDENSVTEIESDYDRIIYVKDVENRGYLILDDAVLTKDAKNSPVGAFVAHSENGKIDLSQYYGQTITVTRLGILEGNFGFTVSDIGKTAFLNDGQINFSQGSSSVEFKTGICFGLNKFLVDCRFTKELASSDMIGTIKPVFGDNLLDGGFALVDKDVHTIYNEKIDWEPLMRNCYAKDIFLFSKSKDGPFTRLNEGGWELLGETTDNGILSHSKPTYFKFRELYYTIKDDNGNDLKCNCQIKYSPEGTPESQAYVWPEQCYQLTIPYVSKGTAGGKIDSSNLRLNISHLVELGAYMDNNSQNIEAYDIVVQEAKSGMIISPGFWKNGTVWCGYEWQIRSVDGKTYLYMITVPDSANKNECYGVTWPIGEKLAENLEVYVTVRRRPTQYNSIYLNQYPYDNPWTPLVDSANNLVIQGDRIYLGGKMVKNSSDITDGTSGFTRGPVSGMFEIAPISEDGISFNMASTADARDVKKIYQKYTIGDGQNKKEIIWEYEFLDSGNPIVTLNADFAPNLISRDTSSAYTEEKYKNDALLILRALGVNKLKFTAGEEYSYATTYRNIQDFILDGTSGKVFNELDDETSSALQNIDWEIKPNNADVLDALRCVYKNNKYIQIVSNLGLLNKAACDTEDRLLSIERTIFGADYSTNLSGKQEINYTGNDGPVSANNIGNLGFPRLLEWLDKHLFYKEALDLNGEVGYSSGRVIKNNVLSLLDTFLIDNYGVYDRVEELKKPDGTISKYSYQSAYDAYMEAPDAVSYITESFADGGFSHSHLAELWMYYRSLSVANYIPRFTKWIDHKEFKSVTYNDFDYEVGLSSARSVIPHKVESGYSWDTDLYSGMAKQSQEILDKYGIRGHGFTWPIQDEEGFKNSGVNLAQNFFGNTLFGIADGKYESGNAYYTSKEHSFSPQSVEGYLYDIIAKLSYLYTMFDDNQTIVSSKTWLKQYLCLDASSFKDGNYLNFTSKDLYMFNDESSEDSIYAGFSFNRDKVVKGYGMALLQKAPTTQYVSPERYVDSVNTYWKNFFNQSDTLSLTITGENNLLKSVDISSGTKLLFLYTLFLIGEMESDTYNLLKTFPKAEKGTKIVDGTKITEYYTVAEIQEQVADFNKLCTSLREGFWSPISKGKNAKIEQRIFYNTKNKILVDIDADFNSRANIFSIKSKPVLSLIDDSGAEDTYGPAVESYGDFDFVVDQNSYAVQFLKGFDTIKSAELSKFIVDCFDDEVKLSGLSSLYLNHSEWLPQRFDTTKTPFIYQMASEELVQNGDKFRFEGEFPVYSLIKNEVTSLLIRDSNFMDKIFIGFENTTSNKYDWPYKVQPLTWEKNNFNDFLKRTFNVIDITDEEKKKDSNVLTLPVGQNTQKYSDMLPSTVGGFSTAEDEETLVKYLKWKFSEEKDDVLGIKDTVKQDLLAQDKFKLYQQDALNKEVEKEVYTRTKDFFKEVGANKVLKYVEDIDVDLQYVDTEAEVEVDKVQHIDMSSLGEKIKKFVSDSDNSAAVSKNFRDLCEQINEALNMIDPVKFAITRSKNFENADVSTFRDLLSTFADLCTALVAGNNMSDNVLSVLNAAINRSVIRVMSPNEKTEYYVTDSDDYINVWAKDSNYASVENVIGILQNYHVFSDTLYDKLYKKNFADGFVKVGGINKRSTDIDLSSCQEDVDLNIKVVYDKPTASVTKTQKYAIFNGIDNTINLPVTFEEHVRVDKDERTVLTRFESYNGEKIDKKVKDEYSLETEVLLSDGASEQINATKRIETNEVFSDVIFDNLQFKDNCYINGQQLPSPDLIFNLNAQDILGLVDVFPTTLPINKKKLVKNTNVEDNPNFTYDNTIIPYILEDIFGRSIMITLDGQTYILDGISAMSIGIQPNEKSINRDVCSPLYIEMNDLDLGSGLISVNYTIDGYRVLNNYVYCINKLYHIGGSGKKVILNNKETSGCGIYITKNPQELNIKKLETFDRIIPINAFDYGEGPEAKKKVAKVEPRSNDNVVKLDFLRIINNIKDNLLLSVIDAEFTEIDGKNVKIRSFSSLIDINKAAATIKIDKLSAFKDAKFSLISREQKESLLKG